MGRRRDNWREGKITNLNLHFISYYTFYIGRVHNLEDVKKEKLDSFFIAQAASPWLYVVPWGLWKVLNYISKRYNNPPIYITESGMSFTKKKTRKCVTMFINSLYFGYFS